MLFNPNWKIQTKPALFSVEGFVQWLEKQPFDGQYDWEYTEGCAVYKYLAAHTDNVWSHGRSLGSIFPSLDVYYEICSTEPWTFGAATERAREALR